MHSHGPSLLKGPVSRKRSCWSDWSPAHSKDGSISLNSQHDWNMSDTTEQPAYEPEIRSELVKRVRREIAAGIYDTPERWEAALDRLLDRLESNDD